jgi:hypothetical protein
MEELKAMRGILASEFVFAESISPNIETSGCL